LSVTEKKRGGRLAAEKTLSFKARRIHVIPIKSLWVLPEGKPITDSEARKKRRRFEFFLSWTDGMK